MIAFSSFFSISISQTIAVIYRRVRVDLVFILSTITRDLHNTRTSRLVHNQKQLHRRQLPTTPLSNLDTNKPAAALNASNTNQPCRQAHRTAPTPKTKASTHPVPPLPQPVRYPLPNLTTSRSCHDSNTQQPAHQACTQHRAALPASKSTANRPSSTTAGARSTTRIRLLRRRMGGTTIKMASLLVKED